MKVIVIEPDQATSENIQTILENDGWIVLSEPNVVKAAKRIVDKKPDAVLLALHMSDSAGIQTFQRLVQYLHNHQEEGYFPTIVILTVWLNPSDSEIVASEGAEDVILKPVEPSELVRRLRSAVIRHRLSKRWEKAGEQLDELIASRMQKQPFDSWHDEIGSNGNGSGSAIMETKKIESAHMTTRREDRPGRGLTAMLGLAAILAVSITVSWSLGENNARQSDRQIEQHQQPSFPVVIDTRLQK